MKFETYQTDLLILPETQHERHNLQSYCQTKKLNYVWVYSDVKKQEWYNKQYLEIPFRSDLKEEIETYFNRSAKQKRIDNAFKEYYKIKHKIT